MFLKTLSQFASFDLKIFTESVYKKQLGYGIVIREFIYRHVLMADELCIQGFFYYVIKAIKRTQSKGKQTRSQTEIKKTKQFQFFTEQVPLFSDIFRLNRLFQSLF